MPFPRTKLKSNLSFVQVATLDCTKLKSNLSFVYAARYRFSPSREVRTHSPRFSAPGPRSMSHTFHTT